MPRELEIKVIQHLMRNGFGKMAAKIFVSKLKDSNKLEAFARDVGVKSEQS
jgi:hypothetical protein